MENEYETLGQLMQKTGKIMRIKEVESGIEIQFAVTCGDVYFGTVAKGFKGTEGLAVNDTTYLEYFEFAERAKVEIETISKMDRQAIQNSLPPETNEERALFDKKREAVRQDLGYKAFFVDSDKHGQPTEAFFLMADDSLVVLKYRPLEVADEPEKYTSAREYLENSKWKLNKAGEFDAVRQLADYLNTSN